MPRSAELYEIEMEWRKGQSKQTYEFEALLNDEFEIVDATSITGRCTDNAGVSEFTIDRSGRFYFGGSSSDHLTDILEKRMVVGERVNIRYSPADPPWTCRVLSVVRKQ